MYKLLWVQEGYREEFLHNKEHLEKKVSQIGADGAEIVWLSPTPFDKGVIYYYNEILAFIEFEEDPEEKDINYIENDFLLKVLNGLNPEQMVDMISKYNDFQKDDKKNLSVLGFIVQEAFAGRLK